MGYANKTEYTVILAVYLMTSVNLTGMAYSWRFTVGRGEDKGGERKAGESRGKGEKAER